MKREAIRGIATCRIIMVLFLVTVLTVLQGGGQLLSASPAKGPDRVTGRWMGVLDAGTARLRLIFVITLNNEGLLRATMQSPDQGPAIFPISDVTFADNTLAINAESFNARFKGKLEDDSTIEGNWTQGEVTLPLRLVRSEEAEHRPERPQDTQPPFPYQVREVNFKNDNDGITLYGTLTIPEGSGPFPAVVLASGSGAHTRDQVVMGHRYFAVLADQLTRRGIAVLRYDERGVGESEGNHSSATTVDLASDLDAALDFLISVYETSIYQIGILGHSEGSLKGAIAASRRDDLAWIVSLAGPGVPGEELLHRQTEDINRAIGVSEEDIELTRSINERIYRVLRLRRNNRRAEDRVMSVYARELRRAGIPENNIEERVQSLRLSFNASHYTWFRHFLRLDPARFWTRVDIPVLLVFGEKDLQVNAEINSKALEDALELGRNPNFRTIVYRGKNHLFQNAETGLPGEYGLIVETIDTNVVNDIAEWIKAQPPARF